MFVEIYGKLVALIAVVGEAFDPYHCTLLERESHCNLEVLSVGLHMLSVCVLQSVSVCLVFHAFIYAEPKQINKNQSDFCYESDLNRSHFELIETKVSLLVQQKGVGDECI